MNICLLKFNITQLASKVYDYPTCLMKILQPVVVYLNFTGLTFPGGIPLWPRAGPVAAPGSLGSGRSSRLESLDVPPAADRLGRSQQRRGEHHRNRGHRGGTDA